MNTTAAQLLSSAATGLLSTTEAILRNSTGGELTTSHQTTSVTTVEGENIKAKPRKDVHVQRETLATVGVLLWIVLILIILGNLSCFYAVAKNLKSILTHPFFQSNVLCVYLSVVDVWVVFLVGVPTALCYCVGVKMFDNFYTTHVMPPILHYLLWLQLLIITFISIDRAIHVMRPLQYRWGISKKKTIIVCSVCTVTPFLIFVLPFILVLSYDEGAAMICTHVQRTRDEMFELKVDYNIPMTCKLMVRNAEAKTALKHFYTVCESGSLLLTMVALAVSNILITFAIIRSQKMQSQYTDVAKKNMNQRIRVNSIVTIVSSVLVLGSVLPFLALDWITRFIHPIYNKNIMLGLQLMVFLGPLFNPWIYPIRMASIRDFLVSSVKSKRDEFVSSVSATYMKMRSVSQSHANAHHVEPQTSMEPVDLLLNETQTQVTQGIDVATSPGGDAETDPLQPQSRV